MRTDGSKKAAHGPSCESQDMASVLALMCEGSLEAFELFYSRYAPLVLRMARRLLEDRMEAEDLCHDVFIEALRKGNRYEAAKGSVEAWLAVMTRSRAMDRLRRSGRLTITDRAEAVVESVGSGGATPEEKALERLERSVLREVLDELPTAQRKAVVGAYFGGKSQREMAQAWEVPLGTVKSWVRYGLGHMRKGLARRGWLDGEKGGLSDEGKA
ncbi:RNA polymerase sigma factor [Paenibacillus sp. 1P07SE]|uniref:RNA polymerase sigma factor n=1 Tax=Paenibacillus sp. 1P07SE TaxID=3132209 RepID=UPI0039A65559